MSDETTARTSRARRAQRRAAERRERGTTRMVIPDHVRALDNAPNPSVVDHA